LADVTGPNNTVTIESNQALLFIDGANECNWPQANVQFSWEPSAGLFLLFHSFIFCKKKSNLFFFFSSSSSSSFFFSPSFRNR